MKTKLLLTLLFITTFHIVKGQSSNDQEETKQEKSSSVFNLIKKHKYEEALKIINLWVEEDSNHSDPHYYKGYVLLVTNQFEESRKELIRSISIDSNETSTWIYYGLTYELQNNIVKANEIYSSLLEKINRDLLKKTYMANSFEKKFAKITVLKLLNSEEELQKEIKILKKEKLAKDEKELLEEMQKESREKQIKKMFL